MKLKTRFIKIVWAASFVFLFVFTASAQSGNDAKQSENSADRPLQITKKQPPRVRVFEKCFSDYGTTELKSQVRVTFAASGEIGAVELVRASGCGDFDDESIRVAHLIQFKPAIKDGSPVTVTKQLVYAGAIGRPPF